MRKQILLALSMLSLLAAPARCDEIVKPGGQGPTGTTCLAAAIPTSSTLVTLVAPSQYITIVNLSASATLYFSPTTPATTAKFPIGPNSAYSYSGASLDRFYIIGSGAGDNYGVIAH